MCGWKKNGEMCNSIFIFHMEWIDRFWFVDCVCVCVFVFSFSFIPHFFVMVGIDLDRKLSVETVHMDVNSLQMRHFSFNCVFVVVI